MIPRRSLSLGMQRLLRVLLVLLVAAPLLACGPIALLTAQSPSREPSGGAGIPIPFAELPVNAPCRIAATFAATVNGLIYSQGGVRPDRDPIDPTTGTYYSRTGPRSYDCSGLTLVAYRRAGITLGNTTKQQINDGWEVPCTSADLHGAATTCWATGDLVLFFDAANVAEHVEMYVHDGVFAACLNWTDGCRVWQRAPASFPPHYLVRRIVNDCVRYVQEVVGGSWRGRGIQAAMQAMGLAGAAITNHFNSPDAAGGARHGGTDFAIAAGTPLFALFGGTVEVDATGTIEGNYIIIRSASGQRAYYGHRMEATGLQGKTIAAGDPIGRVGYTGLVRPAGPAGAHVHFQITDDAGDAWIDAELYFGSSQGHAQRRMPWQRAYVWARAA